MSDPAPSPLPGVGNFVITPSRHRNPSIGPSAGMEIPTTWPASLMPYAIVARPPRFPRSRTTPASQDGVRDAVGADATAHDLARGVDVPRGAELVARQTAEVGDCPGLPEECVHEAVGRETAAHDLAGVVDVVRRAGTTAEGPEVRHLAALPEDGMTGGRRRRGESTAGRLSLIVDREGDAETEVLHVSVLPEERMHLMGGDLALAGDETGVADSMCDAAAAAERPEVRQDAVVPQERTRLGSAVSARPDNPSRFVDPLGLGRRVTRQDSQDSHRDRGRGMRRRYER